MEVMKNKIQLCEKFIETKNSSPKVAIIMISRYYAAYLMGEDIYLQKAYYTARKAYELYPSNIDLFLYMIYLNIEAKNTDKAHHMLEAFEPYSKFYKNNNPKIYARYLFLLVMFELRFLNERNVIKHINNLEEFVKKQECAICDEILSHAYIKSNNVNKAYTFLESAFNRGNRGIFMYLTFYEIYKLGGRYFENKIIISFLNWANNNGVIRKNILDKNNNLIKALVKRNLSLFSSIFLNLDIEWLLIEVCKSYQDNKDYSINAYRFYKEAEKKQIYIQEFNKCLILSAVTNNIEDIGRYSMEFYLKNNKIDFELKPFIYHVLLTRKKLRHFITNYSLENDILEFATESVVQGFSGRYYNSIYRYALENMQEYNEHTSMIESYLYKDLFVFKLIISNPLIKYIWINQREKKEVKVYKVENGVCEVKISGSYFRIISLDEEQKNIIDEEVKLEKQIENADIWLYKYFLEKNYDDIEIFIALSGHYLGVNEPTEKIIEILNTTISFKGISQAHKMQVSAVLGNLLFLQNRYDKALVYYEEVDENYLNERYIEIMFKVFINTHEYEKALKLIINKSQLITEKILFNALKTLSKNKKYKPLMANSIYELLIKGYYDPELLEIVLEYYNGGQEEWHSLDQALSNMSIHHIKLDGIILENSIWTRNFNKSSQLVFLRMYEMSVHNDFIDKFIYYICFEITINMSLPEMGIITALEKRYEQQNDYLIAYSLSCIYLKNSLTTTRSKKILEDAMSHMESNNILLPIFKEIEHREFLTLYVEKNQCFTYKSTPGKEIYLHYKGEYDENFTKILMNYFKFGIYIIALPVFHNEKLTFYFSENTEDTSFETQEDSIQNIKANLKSDAIDKFFTINNALIYNDMFRYNEVENIIKKLVKPVSEMKGKIL